MTSVDATGAAAGLVLTAGDFAETGWRMLPADDAGARSDGSGLEAVLAGRLPEESVVDLADSPLFVRPAARLAYSSAAVFGDRRAAAEALAVVASVDFAAEFALAVAADVVVAPGGAELLGSHTRPIDVGRGSSGTTVVGHRTTFGGATAEHVVPVHVDLLVLGRGLRLVLVWLADAPDPFPDAGRDHLLARLVARLEG